MRRRALAPRAWNTCGDRRNKHGVAYSRRGDYYVKQNFSKDAPPELLEQIARENVNVLTAIGAAARAASGPTSACRQPAIDGRLLPGRAAAEVRQQFLEQRRELLELVAVNGGEHREQFLRLGRD